MKFARAARLLWWRHVAGRPGPLRERSSPGETDGHKPAKYFHPLHFQWPAAFPATAGNRLAAIQMLRWNWKNPATPQSRLSVSAIRPPAKHRREILESKSPHGCLRRASNGQRKCWAPQPSAAGPTQRDATECSGKSPRKDGSPVAAASRSDLNTQADAGAPHIVSTLVLSICWASFVQDQPRNPTHKRAQRSTIPPNPAQPAMHRAWIRNFYPIGGQKVRMSLPQGRRVTRVEPAGRKGETNIPFTGGAGTIEFTIPRVLDYEVAALYSA